MRARMVDTTLVAHQLNWSAPCRARSARSAPIARRARRVAARGGTGRGGDPERERIARTHSFHFSLWPLGRRAGEGALTLFHRDRRRNGGAVGRIGVVRGRRNFLCLRALRATLRVDNRVPRAYDAGNNPSEPAMTAQTPANRNEPAPTPADLQAAWALHVGGLAPRDQIRALTGGFAPRPRPSRLARATPERSPPSPPSHRLHSARACA